MDARTFGSWRSCGVGRIRSVTTGDARVERRPTHVTTDGRPPFRVDDARARGKTMANPFTHSVASPAPIVGARPSVTELAVERVLDKRYKIVAPIGAGGSSQVYLAQDTALNREVALQGLAAAAAADPQRRNM